MAELIVLPKMTLTMEEGLLGNWYVKEGDVIKADDPLCSVENEKEVADVLSVYEGTILKIIGIEGETYPSNSPIAVVGEPGEDYSALLEASATKEPKPSESKEALIPQVQSPSEQLGSGGVQGNMMPKVRRLVVQKGIDIGKLIEFCAGRKITETEVEAFEKTQGNSGVAGGFKPELMPGDEVVKASSMRKTIAKNMMKSCNSTASLTNFMEVDLTDAFALIEKFKNEEKKISVTALMIKASAFALREHKIVNTVYNEDAGEIINKADVNIACAVDLLEGLAVPVIKDADKKDVHQISNEIVEFAKKGKEGTITNEDMENGTFTVSNVGMFDVLAFTPIINFPQSAILGVGTVRTLPRYTEDPNTVLAPRKIVQLALTYDHRVIDGAPAARFLNCVKSLLEEPKKLT